MIAELQRRPWSIHTYALIVLAIGLESYIGALHDLLGWEVTFAERIPQFPWNQDWTIVALSARFTITCIPVAMIWVWRIRFARTLVTLFTVLLLIALIRVIAEGSTPLDALSIAKTLALGTACALLFTRSASRWLEPKEEAAVAEVFE